MPAHCVYAGEHGEPHGGKLKLPDELARVDGLLDDPVFFAPFVPFFDPRRPSTPMETYLRFSS